MASDIYDAVCVALRVHARSCSTLCNLVDYSLPGSSVRGISQARVYWSGLLFLLPGGLPDPGIKPASLVSPVLAGGNFTTGSLESLNIYEMLSQLTMMWTK